MSRWMWFATAACSALAQAPVPAAARTYSLTLEGAVQHALEASPSARRIALEAERTRLVHARDRRDAWPSLGLDLQAPLLAQDFAVLPLPGSVVDTVRTGGGAQLVTRQVFGKITTTRTNASGDLRLRQLLPWRGALTALSTVYYRDEETAPLGVLEPRRDYLVTTSVGLDVPLLGRDPQRQQRRRAAHDWDAARHRQRTARAQLAFETVSRYLALLRARRSLDIVHGASEQARQAQDLAHRKVRAGLLAEVDGMRMDVHRAERDARLAEAEAELERAMDAFKVFLGVALDDTLALVEEPRPFAVDVQVQEAVRRARARRAEVGLAERDVALLEQDRRRPHWPELSLSLRYGGSASEAVLDRALESISANNLSFSLSMQVPLWDAGRASLEAAGEEMQIALRRLEVEELRGRIELEVRDAARQMQDAVRRYELFDLSARAAEEMLRINNERYDRGLVDTTSYLNAQADAAAARLGRTGALLDLHQARARLQLVTLEGEW